MDTPPSAFLFVFSQMEVVFEQRLITNIITSYRFTCDKLKEPCGSFNIFNILSIIGLLNKSFFF